MEKKLKLSPKQLLSLQQVQTQKQQLNTLFQDLNQKEGLIVELVLEMNSIDSTKVDNIKLDGEYLTYQDRTENVKPKEEKKKKVVKSNENIA